MTSLEDIERQLRPEPLDKDELEKYYQDLDEERGGNHVVKELRRAIMRKEDTHRKFFFYGYGGGGKSTELNRLVSQIENEIFVVKLSVINELDILNFNYIDLIILLVEKLFSEADAKHIPLNDDLLNSIQEWINTEEISHIKQYGVEAGATIGAGVSTSWFFDFFSKLRAASQVSASTKKVITEAVEKKLSDFISRCNALIREIQLNLPKIGKEKILIIMEDLDKIPLGLAEVLFFRHNHIFTSLKTNIIFTYPLSLVFNIDSQHILNQFDRKELPLIKVTDKKGNDDTSGQEILKALVCKRIDLSCFEQEAFLLTFIKSSGGRIRDLFRMIINAANFAMNADRTQINQEDVTHSLLQLRREFNQTISEKPKSENEEAIALDTYFETLTKLAKDPLKQADNTAASLDLRHNFCILSYNAEGWSDVHPIVKDILKARQLI